VTPHQRNRIAYSVAAEVGLLGELELARREPSSKRRRLLRECRREIGDAWMWAFPDLVELPTERGMLRCLVLRAWRAWDRAGRPGSFYDRYPEFSPKDLPGPPGGA